MRVYCCLLPAITEILEVQWASHNQPGDRESAVQAALLTTSALHCVLYVLKGDRSSTTWRAADSTTTVCRMDSDARQDQLRAAVWYLIYVYTRATETYEQRRLCTAAVWHRAALWKVRSPTTQSLLGSLGKIFCCLVTGLRASCHFTMQWTSALLVL